MRRKKEEKLGENVSWGYLGGKVVWLTAVAVSGSMKRLGLDFCKPRGQAQVRAVT